MPIRLCLVWLGMLVLSGCTYRRQLTPWLRSYRHVPLRFMAESGGNGPYDTSRTERKIAGRWVEIPGSGDDAFAFADQRRAVVGNVLFSEEGELRHIPCAGVLRAPPSGDALLCIGREQGWRKPTVAKIWWYDIDGKLTRHQRVLAPKQQAADAKFGDQLSFDFLGFAPEGLLFTTLETRDGESFASDRMKYCEAHQLHTDEHWSVRGRLHFRVARLWRCHSSREWRRFQGLQVHSGHYAQDARGLPDW